MPRLDHVAVESPDPDRCAEFYERFLHARIVRTEGHPVMAYVDAGGAIAIHEEDGPGTHVAFRMSAVERAALKQALDDAGIPSEERDHDIAVGLFFEDPDGRRLEAVTYGREGDPRRPPLVDMPEGQSLGHVRSCVAAHPVQ
jgi:catechol 2,3-dioxygenase-like lactoylglutathione lyase family enzyme